MKTLGPEGMINVDDYLNDVAKKAKEAEENVVKDMPSTSAGTSTSISAPDPLVEKTNSKPKRSRRQN